MRTPLGLFGRSRTIGPLLCLYSSEITPPLAPLRKILESSIAKLIGLS